MIVVVPQRVEAVAAARRIAHQARVLRLVFGDDVDRALAAARRADAPDDVGEDVRRRRVLDVLRRVEAQAVEVELVDPVARVLDEERAGRRAGPRS